MKLSWMDWTWAWTQRYLMVVGALWMGSALIGPEIETNWIVISGALVSLLTLLIVKPRAGR